MHSITIKFLSSMHFHDVDDVVQISLIKVWQSALRCLNKRSVEEHICKIVFSTCIDFLNWVFIVGFYLNYYY